MQQVVFIVDLQSLLIIPLLFGIVLSVLAGAGLTRFAYQAWVDDITHRPGLLDRFMGVLMFSVALLVNVGGILLCVAGIMRLYG